jgi:hypothetical protein
MNEIIFSRPFSDQYLGVIIIEALAQVGAVALLSMEDQR